MAESNITPDRSVTDDILQCPLCFHQLEIPVTLRQCLHTFCKECLDELPQATQDDVTGWTCPRCRKFSSTEDVRQNDFLHKLLQVKNTDGKAPVECKYCHSKTEIKWQCSDCRIELCSPCCVNHVNIPLLKKHRIATLDADTSSSPVIDEVLFCPSHDERLQELNCKECEVPLCVLCEVEAHNTHVTETVHTALSRIIPEVEQKCTNIAKSVQHLEAKVKVIRSKIEDTKKLYAESRETVHQRIEYMITMLKEIEKEQAEILLKEERQAVTRLEETKLKLEEKVEEMKQLLNMISVTTSSAKNASLLEELQGSLLQNVQTCYEYQYAPMVISIPWHTLNVSPNEEQCKAELSKAFGKLMTHDFYYKIATDGQSLDNHYTYYNISSSISRMANKPTEIVDLSDTCFRISLIQNSLYVPLVKEIAVYDLGSKLTTHIRVPFVPLVVKTLPNQQIAVGSCSGFYLYDSLEPNVEAVQLEKDGEYSDIDVYGNIFHVFRCDTSEILTFKPTRSSECRNIKNPQELPWVTDYTIMLSCISEPCNSSTICRTEDSFVVSSFSDKCLFWCDMQGKLLRRIMCGNSPTVCGVDVDENIILTNYRERMILSYNVKEDAIKTRSVSPLPGKPWDVLFHNSGNLWILVEMRDGVDFKLLKFSPETSWKVDRL